MGGEPRPILDESVSRQAMRELIGKIRTKDRSVIEAVYLSELVRCQECEQTVPIGIEVVTVKRDGKSRKVLHHGYYCRAHGHDHETRVQSLQMRPPAERQHASADDFYKAAVMSTSKKRCDP